MVVDVSNLDLTALRCWQLYTLSMVASEKVYGISCNVDYYAEHFCKASRYLWLANNCNENLTDTVFCEIEDYIDWLKRTDLFKTRVDCPCDEADVLPCTLSVNEELVPCTSGMTINLIR